MLVMSAVLHTALLLLLVANPSPSPIFLPGVVSVELVAAPASPVRIVAPPKPVPKKIVLPEQPTTPKPEPKKIAKKVPPPDLVERDYDDVLARLRADAGERVVEPVETPAPVPAAAASGRGIGRPVSPEVAAWVKQAKIHVRPAWVLPAGFRTQALEAHLLVDLDAEGKVIGVPEVVRRSGNPWFDEGVVRAIQKASPLPPPPAADQWVFVFVPGDSY